MRLLLVEDDDIAALGVSWALADEGFEVQVQHTGRPVLGLVAHIRPDVLLMDLTLPDVDGAVVAQAVRQTWPALPIIITTGHEKQPRLASLLSTPKTSFLRKPYSVSELVETIRSLTTR